MIELQKMPWSEDAAENLADALGDTLPVIGGEVVEGRSELWQVIGYGWVVSRLEQRANGDVLVLLAGQKIDGGEFHYIDSVKAFCNLAASIGCVAVEMQTHRPGIGKMVQQIGFKEVARKYELNLQAVKNGE